MAAGTRMNITMTARMNIIMTARTNTDTAKCMSTITRAACMSIIITAECARSGISWKACRFPNGSERIRKDILAVFGMIAEAESHVHGVPVTEIHFHEVGTMDAVADIAAVCILMDRLAPDQVVVSPVHVGSGQVKCAHGILPVPAPATAFILKDVPIYGGEILGELCTPTGAALLKYFASRFGAMPVMRTAAIGYGMGKKDFPAANCVRALFGETEQTGDIVAELSCNVDDMTAEEAGYAMEALFAAGALEVYTTPAGMKKSRPGLILHVMCRQDKKDEMALESEKPFPEDIRCSVPWSLCRRLTAS